MSSLISTQHNGVFVVRILIEPRRHEGREGGWVLPGKEEGLFPGKSPALRAGDAVREHVFLCVLGVRWF